MRGSGTSFRQILRLDDVLDALGVERNVNVKILAESDTFNVPPEADDSRTFTIVLPMRGSPLDSCGTITSARAELLAN